jgi:hypothetical protein
MPAHAYASRQTRHAGIDVRNTRCCGQVLTASDSPSIARSVEHVVDAFLANDVTGRDALALSQEDLRTELNITGLAARKLLFRAIHAAQLDADLRRAARRARRSPAAAAKPETQEYGAGTPHRGREGGAVPGADGLAVYVAENAGLDEAGAAMAHGMDGAGGIEKVVRERERGGRVSISPLPSHDVSYGECRMMDRLQASTSCGHCVSG